MQRASSTRALGAGTILTAVFVTLVLAVLPGVARADALEDVAVPVDGLTMTFDLDTAAKTATFADVDEPSLATTVTTPRRSRTTARRTWAQVVPGALEHPSWRCRWPHIPGERAATDRLPAIWVTWAGSCRGLLS